MSSEILPAAGPANQTVTTRQLLLEVPGKGRFEFRLAEDGQQPPRFSLGIRKSGSTMLHRIVNFLARHNTINAIDLPWTFFRHGVDDRAWRDLDLEPLIAPGNVYVGFRAYPQALARYPGFQEARKILMFRDPRDALVSQYFSDAYSHSLPSRESEAGAQAAEEFERKRAAALASDLEDYVLKHARSMNQTLIDYAPLLNDPNCLPLRYEEYVFQKLRLINKILQHFEWSCAEGRIENLMKMIDEVPEEEDKQRFVRRVIPGDHRNKLSRPAIRRLNKILEPSMAAFDYY